MKWKHAEWTPDVKIVSWHNVQNTSLASKINAVIQKDWEGMDHETTLYGFYNLVPRTMLTKGKGMIIPYHADNNDGERIFCFCVSCIFPEVMLAHAGF